MKNSAVAPTALLVIVLAAAGAARPAAAGLADYPFRVETVELGSEYEVVARNDGPAPITLRATVTDAQNIVGDRRWPVVAVVGPKQSKVLGRLFRAKPEAAASFGFSYRHEFGDLSAVHDQGALYRLPFESGRTFLVSQAHGGTMATHNSPDSAYAVDIAMPEGTPILAARAGVVIDVENSHVRGGRDADLLDKANAVTILHNDGTMARYVHLMAGKHAWVGEEVGPGTLIGYSGSTGYSSGPHLHFVVERAHVAADGTLSHMSLPVTFYAYNPPLQFEARQGMMVTSNYNASGMAPPIVPVGADPVRGR